MGCARRADLGAAGRRGRCSRVR